MSHSKPNIVLIVSDDMGYSDIPKFGNSEIATPSLDRLADGGTTLHEGYVTAPICTPSRIGMITGRHQQRMGIFDMYSHPQGFELFRNESTLPARLREAGYATGLVGKWHMGPRECISGTEPGHPIEHGFDSYVGIPWGMSSYQPGATLYRNRRPFSAPTYLTDFFGDEACSFINDNRDGPFFLMLAFNAVHAPLEATDMDLNALGGEFPGSPDRKTYGAMLRSLDRNVGRVLDALAEAGLEENSLVFFINDNGGGGNHTPRHTRNTARNAPLRGYKFDLYEGGVRVPFMVKWPKRIAAGQSYHGMCSALDILPTACAAAGIPVSNAESLDGVNLLPFLPSEPPAGPSPQPGSTPTPATSSTARPESLARPGSTPTPAAGSTARLESVAQPGSTPTPAAGSTARPESVARPGSTPHEELFWCNRTWAGPKNRQSPVRGFHNWAMRRGNLKYVRRAVPPDYNGGEPWELYDLSRDLGEQHDLAPEYPGLIRNATDRFHEWLGGLPPPRE
jgi:arylsulfatase A-like enzyme